MCCAEFNAIVSAFRYHADLTSATLYTTGVPCPRCATKIVQSGIKTVVYGGKDGSPNAVQCLISLRYIPVRGRVAISADRCESQLVRFP